MFRRSLTLPVFCFLTAAPLAQASGKMLAALGKTEGFMGLGVHRPGVRRVGNYRFWHRAGVR